jgi:tetratricopeptide (TPR) repeat protein
MRLAPSSRILAAMLAAALLAAPGALAAGAERPLTEQQYLDIPGIGRVPIPLPPGARVFSPQRRPTAPVEPELTPERAPQTARDSLDDLIRRLSLAESDEEESALAQAIGRLWARSASPTVDLLMHRALVAVGVGAESLALDLFDRIVILEPEWAEALVGRANVRIALGDLDGAERDLESALRLEPRRFDALGALGALRERAGAAARALEAYRRARALDPRREEWRKAEERLRLEVEGRDI